MPLDPLEIIGGLAIGEGLGGAIADTVTPRLQDFANSQWASHADKPLDAAEAAAVAAEKYAQLAEMQAEALLTGYNAARFQHLYDITVTAPGVGELLTMLRRGTISTANFQHGLDKAKLEPMWSDALLNLQNVIIPGPDLAYMVVRGVVPDGGTLPSSLPTHSDQLQLPPQLALDTMLEASKTGWDAERFAGLVARSGLAMAPIMAAQANFRGILTDNDYLLTIARGDLFPAYADPVKQVAREVPTARDYVQARLRGWRTQPEMYAGSALHGMTQVHTDLLYEIERRPLAPHAITTGLARGGQFNPEAGEITDPYQASVHQADLGPEWYDLAIANKYTYPSAFVLRSLAQSGDLGGQAAVEQVLLEIGWKPSFATKVSTAWTGGATAGDPHQAKAETQLWSTTHRSYVAEEITDATATTALSAAGVAAAAVPAILTLWGHERSLVRKQLSPTQIRKALNLGVVNPASGAPWTIADAHAALLLRGYDDADATVFLQE
jgi:hypothetical protein